MTIEDRYGVPTVALHTEGKSALELRAYVDGKDPPTGRAVMQEVIEGLTRPFDDADLRPVELDRSTPRLVAPDTEENLHRLFLENHWTDTLPIVLPTEERVAAMLAHTRRRPDEVVGHMRPTSASTGSTRSRKSPSTR